jgi:hypothetical protein
MSRSYDGWKLRSDWDDAPQPEWPSPEFEPEEEEQ